MGEAAATAIEHKQRGRMCSICGHQDRASIEAELRAGSRVSGIASKYHASRQSVMRHRTHLVAVVEPADARAEEESADASPPAPPPSAESPSASQDGAGEPAAAGADPATTAGEAAAAGQGEMPTPHVRPATGCPICDSPAHLHDSIDRALTAAPWNAAAIAERFKVQPAALDVHMRHMIQPAPPPAPPAPRPSFGQPPPVALPATAAEARELLDRHGPSIVPKVIAWARAKYFWWCTSWAGPPGIKEVAYRGWMRALANAPNDSARLVACWKFSAELDRLAATDASVARAASDHARFATAAPASRFDVRGYLATLGTRGVQLRLDATDRVTSFPPGSLNEADRIIIAARRSEIAAFLQQPYEVV